MNVYKYPAIWCWGKVQKYMRRKNSMLDFQQFILN